MNIKHHFFGKNCIIDRSLLNREDATQNLESKGFHHEALLFVNQIHGHEVVVVDEKHKIYGTQNLPKADAIVTNLKDVALAVFTADCAPIVLFDKENNIIAVAHAGWRGAILGVIKRVTDEMRKLGAKNIKAIIGPMIAQDSYEVSQEFFDDFVKDDATNKKFFVGGVTADKHLFDLPSYVEKKLQEAQVSEIINSQIDTYKNENDFFSFRRSTHRKETDCGRNVSVIVMN